MDGIEERARIERGDMAYRRYVMCLRRRDVPAAEEILNRFLELWPPQRVYLRIFQRALEWTGTLFSEGRITFHDEHFITYHTMRLLRRARRRLIPRPPTGPLAMATGMGEDAHLIGLRMVCEFMQSADWQIAWAPSPQRGVVGECVARVRPAALLISVGWKTEIEPARRIIRDIKAHRFDGLIVVGGRVIDAEPTLVAELGAHLTARNGLQLLRRLRDRARGRDMPAPS